MAWATFNFKAVPSRENPGWPDFALANAAWIRAYQEYYGKEPEPDHITIISANYYTWIRYDRRNNETKVPKRIWQLTTRNG